jgi:hypothetical protein
MFYRNGFFGVFILQGGIPQSDRGLSLEKVNGSPSTAAIRGSARFQNGDEWKRALAIMRQPRFLGDTKCP